MSEHTPGRLYIRTNRHPNTDGTPWGWVDLYEPGSMRQASPEGIQVTWSRGQTSEANARRLVACWNACDGISTEALERWPLSEAFEREQDRADSAGRQRDELLAVLHMALPALEAMRKQWPRIPLDDSMDVVEVVRAAIAKVKGGAA